jgi:hypothetical protein
MPRVRRIAKRKREINPMVLAYLAAGAGQKLETDEDSHFEILLLRGPNRGTLRALWQEFGAGILAEWIAKHPGTRPARWWEFDAPRQAPGRYPGFWFDGQLPEPRLQVGGIGQAPWDAGLAYYPEFVCGLPTFWETYDQENPPLFETQASYLQRHGFLAPAERRKLTPADFLPIIWHDEMGPARPENLQAFVREMKEKGRWLGR